MSVVGIEAGAERDIEEGRVLRIEVSAENST